MSIFYSVIYISKNVVSFIYQESKNLVIAVLLLGNVVSKKIKISEHKKIEENPHIIFRDFGVRNFQRRFPIALN